jgi:hypothetical protein
MYIHSQRSGRLSISLSLLVYSIGFYVLATRISTGFPLLHYIVCTYSTAILEEGGDVVLKMKRNVIKGAIISDLTQSIRPENGKA